MDIVDTATRSKMMAGIRSKDTQPELRLRRFLHGKGFRYKLHDRKLPGTPDIVLPRYRVAIFVHGCFWHQHPGCKYSTTPQTNQEKWRAKFEANLKRDQKNTQMLISQGWRPIVVWECALRKAAKEEELDWIIEVIQGAVI